MCMCVVSDVFFFFLQALSVASPIPAVIAQETVYWNLKPLPLPLRMGAHDLGACDLLALSRCQGKPPWAPLRVLQPLT